MRRQVSNVNIIPLLNDIDTYRQFWRLTRYGLRNRKFAQSTIRYCDGGLLEFTGLGLSQLCFSYVSVHSRSIVAELDAPPLKTYVPIVRVEMPAKVVDGA